MDYDGFHPMVFGADLKGMKMVGVTEIKPDHVILNTVIEKSKLSDVRKQFRQRKIKYKFF